MSNSAHSPDALLLIATGCAHCPQVLAALSELVKEGRIGRLEVINIVQRPEAAQALGVRSAPWTRIGEYEFTGLQSAAELRRWAEQAAAAEPQQGDYLARLLEEQELERVTERVRADAKALIELIDKLADAETPLAVRIGIGAVLEDLAGSDIGRAAQPRLLELLGHEDARMRADAAHFLGLAGDAEARAALAPLTQDPDPQVREIATEAREALNPED